MPEIPEPQAGTTPDTAWRRRFAKEELVSHEAFDRMALSALAYWHDILRQKTKDELVREIQEKLAILRAKGIAV